MKPRISIKKSKFKNHETRAKPQPSWHPDVPVVPPGL